MNLSFQPGKYRARITKTQLSKTNNGNPQWVVSFQPLGLYKGDELLSCADFERTIFRVINDNTIEWVMKDLETLGYDRENFAELDSGHANAFPFVGVELDVRCEHESYQGKTRDKWKFDFGGGLDIAPLEHKDVNQLQARFGNRLKRPGVAAARPAKVAVRTATEVQAEEVF